MATFTSASRFREHSDHLDRSDRNVGPDSRRSGSLAGEPARKEAAFGGEDARSGGDVDELEAGAFGRGCDEALTLQPDIGRAEEIEPDRGRNGQKSIRG